MGGMQQCHRGWLLNIKTVGISFICLKLSTGKVLPHMEKSVWGRVGSAYLLLADTCSNHNSLHCYFPPSSISKIAIYLSLVDLSQVAGLQPPQVSQHVHVSCAIHVEKTSDRGVSCIL